VISAAICLFGRPALFSLFWIVASDQHRSSLAGKRTMTAFELAELLHDLAGTRVASSGRTDSRTALHRHRRLVGKKTLRSFRTQAC
jgi:hypothetical protein